MNDNHKIEVLLNEVGANKALRRNVQDILKYHSATLEIYSNTIINGLTIGLKLKKGSLNTVFISPMQSGKSGSIFFLNYVLHEIGFLKADQNILFLTSMRDTDLFDQNIANLQKQYFDCANDEYCDSRIFVKKIDELFKYPDPFKIVKEKNIALFIRDEDHYGSGIESTFDCGFMQDLRLQLPDMPLITVSATPFDILDSINKGFKVTTVNGSVPEQYLGISKMLDLGLVENIESSFTPYNSMRDRNGRTIYKISDKLDEYMRHLISFESGLGIIRVSNSGEAFLLRKIAKNKYQQDVKVITIGSVVGCDYSISEGMNQVKLEVNAKGKRVFLIVVMALSAGKDFKSLKQKIRFVIETRVQQLANGAQGLPGRLCGYHTNRSFKILASINLLKKYSEFEKDWKIINNENWRNDLLKFRITGLSTQVRLQQRRKQGEFIPIETDPIKVSYDELKTYAGRLKLNFLEDDAFSQILKCFESCIWYEEASVRLKSKISRTTIRVASSYCVRDNRVYKLMGNYKKGDDFGTVMFKKKNYDYGILISNIPVGKKSKNGIENDINFRGVEIYKASQKIFLSSDTITDNHSMYNS